MKLSLGESGLFGESRTCLNLAHPSLQGHQDNVSPLCFQPCLVNTNYVSVSLGITKQVCSEYLLCARPLFSHYRYSSEQHKGVFMQETNTMHLVSLVLMSTDAGDSL